MDVDLNDLIEAPRETLDVELKEWLDLSDGVSRANIARHLAALTNHGGGYLVFGFKDDLTRDVQRPSSLESYNRDTFTGIVKRYLTPAFQCEVQIILDKGGDGFPVVRVPSHGRAPVAARADGPNNDKGRPQGIQIGLYYIRKPGPESAPILTAEEWLPLIRRCVLNDRDSLLRDISGLVQGTAIQVPSAVQRLVQWHQQGEERFLQLLTEARDFTWPVPLKDNRYQLSYLISTDGGEAVPLASLSGVLEEINNEVRDTVWTGWSMFYPFNRREIAPAFHPELADGGGVDVLEANLLGDREFHTSLPDFWRIAADGRATLIRAYREDRERSVREFGRPGGTWLSPETVVRETAEIVTHARLFARRLETATQISFRCTWTGLRNRYLADFDPGIDWREGQIARANQRTVDGEWPLARISADWPSVVADLSCPILRLFGFADCGPGFVRRLAPRFVKL